MILHTILTIVGFILIACVVYLGYLTLFNPGLVPWFGIASAVLAPSGFALIAFTLSSGDRLAIRRLPKVPESQKLIEKATTQEEKLKALQAERSDLIKSSNTRHKSERFLNNPLVGLVTSSFDRDRGKKRTCQYDPHIDL